MKFASAYGWLGNAFDKSGNKEKALSAYEKFIRYEKATDSFVPRARKRMESLSTR